MSDDPKAARLQAIVDAQGVKPMTSEAFDALAMPAEDPKAAPISYECVCCGDPRCGETCGKPDYCCAGCSAALALRSSREVAPSFAAEPVVSPTSTIAGSETHDGTFASSGAASAANPAPSLADESNRRAQLAMRLDFFLGTETGLTQQPFSRAEVRMMVTALRAVEAVRALHVPMTAFGDKYCVLCVNEYSGEPSSWPCDTAKAVGVEAVQALLEGER